MIITFGSLNADLIFRMDQLPQPGQTLLASGFTIEAGGKGANQAVAAAQDGADVIMIGAVGNDALKDVALVGLIKAGADISRVITSDLPTGCASITTDKTGANMIAVASGANLHARASQVDDELLSRARVLMVQMETDVAEIAALLHRAKGFPVCTILNLAPAIRIDIDVLRLCDLIVVNEDEAAALAGWLSCGETAKALYEKLGVDIICTLGGKGSEAATADGFFSVNALPIVAVDTTAAGDCFVGVLASALDHGLALPEAMRRASAAAAMACERHGSQSSIPWKQDIDARLAQHV